MAETQEPTFGVLSSMFDWDALSPEEKDKLYFASFPDRAYLEICRLRQCIAELQDASEALSKLTTETLEALKNAEIRSDVYLKVSAKLVPIYNRERKRLTALDIDTAHDANKQRAAVFRKAVEDFVSVRIRQQRSIQSQELADEIRAQPWAKKNKRGDKPSKRYLLTVVRPLMRKARIAARKG